MEIKTKKHFKNLIESLTEKILDEEDLDEMTVTGNVDGYMTPFAFTGNKGKKKKKQISTNSTGYEMLGESLDNKDLEIIKKLIRSIVGDIIRDIWLKRATWNK